MIPIQELLSRIRWDPKLGRRKLIIGDYDRIDGQIINAMDA